LLLALVPAVAFAAQGTGHGDPLGSVVLALTIILVAAKLGGELAVRLGQSGVLGELVVGVLLGNLTLVGYSGLDHLWIDPSIDMLARLGVLILLFEVGLESTVGQMLKVGLPSLLVATLGVVTPFALGWGVGAWLLPGHSVYVHAFLGATLCATSVAITARVLKDLNRLQTREARIILGAAGRHRNDRGGGSRSLILVHQRGEHHRQSSRFSRGLSVSRSAPLAQAVPTRI